MTESLTLSPHVTVATLGASGVVAAALEHAAERNHDGLLSLIEPLAKLTAAFDGVNTETVSLVPAITRLAGGIEKLELTPGWLVSIDPLSVVVELTAAATVGGNRIRVDGMVLKVSVDAQLRIDAVSLYSLDPSMGGTVGAGKPPEDSA